MLINILNHLTFTSATQERGTVRTKKMIRVQYELSQEGKTWDTLQDDFELEDVRGHKSTIVSDVQIANRIYERAGLR